ncbi:MAG: hypothetical protein QXR30_04470 [Candidatus Woesearchaeota archaeon]
MIFNEKRDTILELKKYINANLIGKIVTIRYQNKEFNGILINETKNLFVLEIDNKIKKFVKNEIEIKIENHFLKGKYFVGTLEKRLSLEIDYKENKILD